MGNNDIEKKIDVNFILDRGLADYSDGDIIIIDKIGTQALEGTMKLDMIVLLYCVSGKVQCETDGKTYTAKAGDVMIGLPNRMFTNYMMSPDFDSKIIGLSYTAAQHNMQITRDVLDLMSYVAANPVIHLDMERQALVTKYYSIIAHKIRSPHGYFHKEIMHSIFQCFMYELFAIIAPHVQYSDGGGSMKQANLLFKRFMELLAKNDGKVRSVKKYAESMCITPKYLSFISKSVTGKTALEWIHQSTVKAIEHYLRHSNMSIKEIADMLDFPNLSFFGKFTKNHLGVSPTEFRRQQSMKNELEKEDMQTTK